MSLSLIWMTSLYPLTLGLQFLHSYIHIKLKYSEHFFQQDIKNYCFTEITINWTKPFFFIAPLDFFSTTFYWAVCFFSSPYFLYLGTTWWEILLLLWLSSLTLKSDLCQVTAIYPPAAFVYSPEVANPSSSSSYLQINTIGVYKKSQQAYTQGCLHSVFDHWERGGGGGVHNKTGPPWVARLYITF